VKILSNQKYNELIDEIQINENEKKETIEKYKEACKFYDEKLNSLYYDLFDLKNALKGNISKDKIKIKLQDMIIRIGGR